MRSRPKTILTLVLRTLRSLSRCRHGLFFLKRTRLEFAVNVSERSHFTLWESTQRVSNFGHFSQTVFVTFTGQSFLQVEISELTRTCKSVLLCTMQSTQMHLNQKFFPLITDQPSTSLKEELFKQDGIDCSKTFSFLYDQLSDFLLCLERNISYTKK